MELGHFDAYYHLFASLNLAYAGSKRIRTIIDDEILRLPRVDESKQRELKQQLDDILKVGLANITDQEAKAEFNEIEQEYQRGMDILTERQTQQSMRFGDTLKTMFSNTAAYVLLVILLAGYQQTILDAYTFGSLLFLHSMFLYNVFVFARSFHPRKTNALSAVGTLFYIVFICIVLIAHGVWCSVAPRHGTMISEVLNVSVCLFICASPFILHTLRVVLHTMVYRAKISKYSTQKIREMTVFISHMSWLASRKGAVAKGAKAT